MRVLVTGASACRGAHTVAALVATGVRVRVLARPGSELLALGELAAQVERVTGDLRDAGDARRAVERCAWVIHDAVPLDGATDRAGAWREERLQAALDGARNLLEASAAAAVGRVVFCSSVATLGLTTSPLARGAGPGPGVGPGPGAPWFARVLDRVEALVLAADAAGAVEACVVLPGLSFGARDRRSVAARWLTSLAAGAPAGGCAAGGVAVCDAVELGRAVLAAAERAPRGSRTVLATRNVTFAELEGAARVVLAEPELAGLRAAAAAARDRSPAWADTRAALAGHYLFADGAPAMRTLGIRDVPLDASLRAALRALAPADPPRGTAA